MSKTKNEYNTPIWLSDWTLIDGRNHKYVVPDVVVKGHTKEEIFNNLKIVEKVVKKLIGRRKKHTLKATNLTLKSQHGYGIEE
jgi:hydroxymethylpyrimidine/phosphomethylpyrimidine kinase